jgi:hypothetical protein
MSSRNSAYLIFLAILFIFNPINGQKTFREGYITKDNGQTLSGLVEWKSGQGTPELCVFKRFEIAVEFKYSAADLNNFGYLNGNRYESVKINGKNEFYEVIIQGSLSLYKKDSKYFVKKNGSDLSEIKNGASRIKTDGKELEFNNLKDLLGYFTENRITLPAEKDIKRDLVSIVTEFNKITSAKYIAYKQDYSSRPGNTSLRTGADFRRIGITAGMNIYTLYATAGANTSVYLPKATPEYTYTIGATYETLLSRKNDHLNLRIDLLFLKQNFYSYSEGMLSSEIIRDDAFLEFTALKVPVLFQYSFNSGKVIPFITAGFSGMVLLDKDYYHIRESEQSYWHGIYTSEDRKIEFRSTELTGIAGAGVNIRMFNDMKLSLMAGAEFGSGIYKQSQSASIGLVQLKQHSIQKFILVGVTF